MYDKVLIEKDWCKGCGICVAFCPKKVLAIKNNKVYLVDNEKCNECGVCEEKCPDFAIYIRRNNNERTKVNAG
ncbi:indolepyruvate ferredoxin oxidoreductase subunit alpha [Calorimonas adulescens]|jgi:4Fe-4S binding domain.|uniref:4Fe-4S dicluster domain-containing protein n=1 Tax=Calorimonas adulescens TaxID=2606906 RepID=A0A5D8Q7U6_9THEO|nr:4Fe-4S binding protein [Calorimonas adulescens]TZE80815.1 4Fe-4S dicluster domain-containing protein [Calorimonas adulescens]